MTDLHVVTSNDDGLPAFLDYLYGGLEGYVAGAELTRDAATKERTKFERKFFAWPSEKDAVVEWVKAQTSTVDVYLAPAIFSKPDAHKESFKATNVVWCEFDGKVPTLDGITDVPKPSLRLRSSVDGFEHWYWRLDSPVTDSAVVETVNRGLAYKLGADSSGWDVNQVLRPVGTINHKRDATVALIEQTDSVVAPVMFDALPTPGEQPQISPSEIPDITDVVLKYSWPVQVATLYKKRGEEIPVGERSTYLMKLGYYLAEMGMTDGEMFAVLRNADDRWGKFKDRTDREQRLVDIIAVARQKYPQVITFDTDSIPVFGLRTFLHTEVEFNWIVEDLIPEQGYFLATGPAGVGKTQYSLRWGMNLALGSEDYLGYKIVKPQRLIFFSLEMGHSRLLKFLETMCATYSEEQLSILENNFLVVPIGEPLYVDNPKGQERVEAIISEFEPDGFMFDSMGSSTSAELSSESAVKSVMDWNDRVRQKFDIFTWYIHHNRKAQGDNKKPNKMSDVYGNQYLVNRSDTIHCLWPGSGHIEVLNLKNRLAEVTDPFNIKRIEHLDFMKLGPEVGFSKAAPTVLEHKPEPEPTKEHTFDSPLGNGEVTGM